LIVISLFLSTFLLFLNHAFTIFVTSDAFVTLHSRHPSYLHFVLSLERTCSTHSSSPVTFYSPSNSRLKIANRSSSYVLHAPALWNSLPPDLGHFYSHSTSSQPHLNSPLLSLSPSICLSKELKTHLSNFSVPPMSHDLDYLWMDISGFDLALLFHCIVISLSFILMSLTALL
jgi:hypothetical protein